MGWLRLNEAAQYLACSVEVLRKLVDEKAVPHSLLAGEPRFLAQRLDEFLLSQEVAPAKKDVKGRKRDMAGREIRPDVDRGKVEGILKWLEEYNDGNEIFVNSFGSKLRKALHTADWQELNHELTARLARWCHPKRPSPRNDEVQKEAEILSMLLFGEVIERDE